jgi:prepilin-type processing-associated H-X9-DG protein
MPAFGLNRASESVATLLRPYTRSTGIFLCPNDPTGDRFSFGKWDGRFTRMTYSWHPGLSQGWSWPDWPNWPGQSQWPWRPLRVGEVLRPAFLWMVADLNPVHSSTAPSELRINICFADGHAKFTRFISFGVAKQQQRPWGWNWYNPRLPVDVEKPCSPTCAEEAAHS